MQKTLNRRTVNRYEEEKCLQPQEDIIKYHYKGKCYTIPRSELTRPLTKEELEQTNYIEESDYQRSAFDSASGTRTKSSAFQHNKIGVSIENSSTEHTETHPEAQFHYKANSLDENLEFMNNLEQNFRQNMHIPCSAVEENNPKNKDDEEKPKHCENLFSLEDCTDSKATVIERPLIKETSQVTTSHTDLHESSPKSLGSKSSESLKTRKPGEVTVKLVQLKSELVHLIDQTINQIGSNQDGCGDDAKGLTALSLHPSGDGSILDYRSRNMQVLKTDSFARRRNEIRTRLYREIGTLLKRLEDLDKLE